jgi:hypothetical protein
MSRGSSEATRRARCDAARTSTERTTHAGDAGDVIDRSPFHLFANDRSIALSPFRERSIDAPYPSHPRDLDRRLFAKPRSRDTDDRHPSIDRIHRAMQTLPGVFDEPFDPRLRSVSNLEQCVGHACRTFVACPSPSTPSIVEMSFDTPPRIDIRRWSHATVPRGAVSQVSNRRSIDTDGVARDRRRSITMRARDDARIETRARVATRERGRVDGRRAVARATCV